MLMVWFKKLNTRDFGWRTLNTTDFIFGKKWVLVNFANDLTINGSVILLFQKVKFIYWSLFNKEYILDCQSSFILDGYRNTVSCFSWISSLLNYFITDWRGRNYEETDLLWRTWRHKQKLSSMNGLFMKGRLMDRFIWRYRLLKWAR